jgi:hypothetical protein
MIRIFGRAAAVLSAAKTDADTTAVENNTADCLLADFLIAVPFDDLFMV